VTTAVVDRLEDLPVLVGRLLGPTDWAEVSDPLVAKFEEAVGGPDAGAFVPPFLLLALTNRLLPQLIDVKGASSGVNYGTGEVRFGPPVAVGSLVRASAVVTAADPVAGGYQTLTRITVAVAGREEPGCVAEAISRYYG